MTARVKTESSELRTPKKPAISQAAESCHCMAYFLNSPSVEASNTARKPTSENQFDIKLRIIRLWWWLSVWPVSVTGLSRWWGEFELQHTANFVGKSFKQFITLWCDCAGPERLSTHKSDLCWRRQPSERQPGDLSFSPALTTPPIHHQHPTSHSRIAYLYLINWPTRTRLGLDRFITLVSRSRCSLYPDHSLISLTYLDRVPWRSPPLQDYRPEIWAHPSCFCWRRVQRLRSHCQEEPEGRQPRPHIWESTNQTGRCKGERVRGLGSSRCPRVAWKNWWRLDRSLQHQGNLRIFLIQNSPRGLETGRDQSD